MVGRLLLQSAVILWLVQAAHTGGHGAADGVPNGPQLNGRKLQNAGGVRTMLMPSKGYRPAVGVSGPNGYGAPSGMVKGLGTKGYGAAASVSKGQGGKPQGGYPAVLSHQNGANGYGVKAGPTNGQQTKGYGVQAGRYGWQGPNGNGYSAGSTGNVPNTKGHGAAASPLNGYGARPNGQGGAGSKPMKGYGQPPYGAGPGMGAFRGLGIPLFAGNYKGYGAQPMAGNSGGYGSAGLGLGPRHGNGWMKGPKQGYGAAAGVSNGQGSKANGYAGARPPFRSGVMLNGYGSYRGSAVRPQPGYGAAAGTGANAFKGYTAKSNGHRVRNAALGGYGGKPSGYGGSKPQKTTKGFGAMSPSEGYGGPAGAPNGQLPEAANAGYNRLPNTKGQAGKGAGEFTGKDLKGGVHSPEQPSAAPLEGLSLQQAITRGAVPFAPQPTSGVHVLVTKEKYPKLLSPLPQEKSYKHTQLISQVTPEPLPALPAKDLKPGTMGPQFKGEKVATAGPVQVVPQSKPPPEWAAVPPEENGRASVSKGQGAKPAKPDCGPSGVPNGQWMKIPRPDYNAAAGASMGMNTKGYGQGGYLGAGYGNGHPFGGYGNDYGAGVQPDYANLGQGVPAAAGKSGIGGLQFAGQPVGTGTNAAGKYGYGFSPYGNAGADKPFGKYGYGGFPNGGQFPGLGSSGNTAGKYGYGRLPYEAQPAALDPEAKSTNKYGLAGSPNQPEPLGLGHSVKLPGKYGGTEVPYAPQAVGFDAEAKSGKYDNQGVYQSQPLETAAEGTAGLTYEPWPRESDSAGKLYVKGEVPTPAPAAEGVGRLIDGYENVGYINGRVQPQVAAVPTPSPNLAYPPVPSRLPVASSFTPDVMPGGVRDLSDLEGKASLTLNSAAATGSEGVAQVPEQPDDLLQEQLPRQIHIQQHLKLHFQPQGGAKDGKYDLNGFFGNSGHQG
ncbi:calymmin isoform X2 [Archocentrus centrarchus]|uniref:calymmin isoform X2 n=1 Tax=Archocentrus centrarchus TaxID=63155 RepID=UPI0011E9D29B|nr:elastin-like isoform X2 [Archocentrus centrarchus]